VPDSGEENDSGSQHYLTPEELFEQAGQGAIAHSEILNKPITPDDADPEALEAARKEMLSTAKELPTLQQQCWTKGKKQAK
jgi:hypothetical protein